MKKDNKKVKKIILVVLIVALAILGIIALIILNIKDNGSTENTVRYTQEDIEIVKEEVTNYLSDKITPQGISRLYGKYKGDNDLNDLYRKLYLFINYLPSLAGNTKNYTADQLHAYYEQNKGAIKKNLGISSEEDFLSIVNYVRDTGYKNEKFSTCKIQTDTFEEIDDYFTFDLSITFERFENEFKVKVHFANVKNGNPLVFYTVD